MSNPYSSIVDLVDRYDMRMLYQLSNDSNFPDGELARMNRLLDGEASKLESALYGTWPLPLVINAAVLSGAVTAGATTCTLLTVTSGLYVGRRIVVGPDGTSPPEIVEIVSVSGTTLTVSGTGATPAGQAGGFSFAHASGAAVGSRVDALADYVAIKTADRLFGRRSARPDGLDKDMEAADKWLQDLLSGQIQIPGIDRTAGPTVHSNPVSFPASWGGALRGTCGCNRSGCNCPNGFFYVGL